MKVARLLTAAVAMSALSGCATVTTKIQDPEKIAKGLAYFLPKREVKITAERTLLDKDDLAKKLTAQQTALASASAAVDEAKALVDQATARAESDEVRANADAAEAVNRDLAIAKADLAKAKAAQGTAKANVDKTQAMLVMLARQPNSLCEYSAKIELLAPTPDTSVRLVADAFHNPLRDDDTKLTITPEGLLSSANVVAADRTGDIIVEIASAIASLGSGTGGPIALIESPSPVHSCADLPKSFAYRFDPIGGIGAVNDALNKAEFPFQVGPITKTVHAIAPANLRAPGKGGALFYRSAIPLTLFLRQCKEGLTCKATDDESTPIDAALVVLPQAGPISYIPMRSSAFVKTVDDVVFDNGMLTSWSASRPSEVLEVVRLPVKVLKAIFSAPAEIVKLRVDLSDQQKGLAASQQAQMAVQAEFRKVRDCVRLAGDNQDKAATCFATDSAK